MARRLPRSVQRQFDVLRRATRWPIWADLVTRLGVAFLLIGIAVAIHWVGSDGLVDHEDGAISFLDVVYFTMISVTTTGFGDITLPGTFGKLTSIVTMIVGISLFVRLAQAIVRPYKVTFPCPQCGLSRHETDAVHCKACGQILCIPDDGD